MPFTLLPATANGTQQPLRLSPHPAFMAPDGLEVKATVEAQQANTPPCLALRFELSGAIDTLCMPAWMGSHPADGLWQHTCAELFVRRQGSPAYQEFNFSPSGQWAAYRFSSERVRDTLAESRHPPLPPAIEVITSAKDISISIHLPMLNLPATDSSEELRLGLSLVAERGQGDLSYWALHHPRADRPDFHHPDGCALALKLPHLRPLSENPT